MKRVVRNSAGAALSIAVLSISACGSDGGAGTSREEFLVRSNAICSDAKREIKRATQQSLSVDQPPSAAKLNAFARQTIIPRLERQLETLRRLPVPSQDARRVELFLDSLESALDRSREQPLIFTLAKDSPYAEPDRLARDYGLTDCISS